VNLSIDSIYLIKDPYIYTMTRINSGISPSELVDKHLLAEAREIKRIPNCIRSGRYSMLDRPEEFKLGKGHVKFFYDKLLYLKNRYDLIYTECINRGFKVRYFGDSWDDLPKDLMNDYYPTDKDRSIVRCRINERLKI